MPASIGKWMTVFPSFLLRRVVSVQINWQLRPGISAAATTRSSITGAAPSSLLSQVYSTDWDIQCNQSHFSCIEYYYCYPAPNLSISTQSRFVITMSDTGGLNDSPPLHSCALWVSIELSLPRWVAAVPALIIEIIWLYDKLICIHWRWTWCSWDWTAAVLVVTGHHPPRTSWL